jgi:protein disulfide-isomerase A6
MAPEYIKAAKGLDPLIPLYAVDCDADKNKQLCAQQVRLSSSRSTLFRV